MDALRWLPNGRTGLGAMLEAIRGARESVRLETYIFQAQSPGAEFAAELANAARRGVQVQVLIDAVGSQELPGEFWTDLRMAGGQVREYNPFGSGRFLIRNHRKLCVVDQAAAYVAGFNIGPDYNGDGVEVGWLDLGVEIRGESVATLTEVFDQHFEERDLRPRLLARFQRRREHPPPRGKSVSIFPVCPGRQAGCLLTSLYSDLATAQRIWICSPYFLPTPKLRRLLRRAARRGADVRVVLPSRSDVPLALFAARRLYSGLLKRGIRIHEYLPQVLHAKVLLIDDAVYVGSSNLDQRSLHLNHELMVRITDPPLRKAAENSLRDMLMRSRELQWQSWRTSRSWMARLRERWAFFMLYRLDPWITHGFTR